MAGREFATAVSRMCLLDLPEPCLLAVLRGCSDDAAAMFSAARAHSRLHQATVLALSRVSVQYISQGQVDGLLQYLDKHGQHVRSISLGGVQLDLSSPRHTTLNRLPNTMQLHSLQLSTLRLQLQPGGGFPGVLGAAGSRHLTQLQLSNCNLLRVDWPEGLAAALAQLPGLQHLSMSFVLDSQGAFLRFPAAVIQQLQQLTYLELRRACLQRPVGGGCVLPSLHGLSRLADLQLQLEDDLRQMPPKDDWLSGCSQLTRLVLSTSWDLVLPPSILSGHTLLQHLEVWGCSIRDGSAGFAQLLSELQTLQHLTHLSSQSSLKAAPTGSLAAYSALTASSRLQHLNIKWRRLPAGAWEYIFPAGRQRPHLTSLNIQGIADPSGHIKAAPPAGALLLSCCPGLQSLNMLEMHCSTEQMAPLQGLSRLHTLLVAPDKSGLEAVAQLTSLRELKVWAPAEVAAGRLLQLTRLRQLTCLKLEGEQRGKLRHLVLEMEDDSDVPVWRQLLWYHCDHRNPEVAQQAAAALAE